MSRPVGDFEFNSAFDVNASKPIDTRFVVDSVADLTNLITYPYVGLLVFVIGEDKYYHYHQTSNNVYGWSALETGGGTSNAVTSVKVGTTAYNPTNGVVSLPAYPTVPTKVSQLTNDSGFTTNTGTVTSVKVGTTAYNPSSGVVSLPAYPSVPTKVSQLTNDSGFTTNTGTVTSVKVGTTAYNPSSGVVSLPAYPSVPTKVSQLTNDSGFTTNTGTVTSVKVGTTSYSPSSGVVSLPAYPTIPSSLPASDVYSWAKASSKPTYNLDEVSDGSTRKLANYLPLSGGTLTGGLGIASGSGISDASGNGMLVYHPSSWTGVSSSQWGVGAVNCQGVIRSDANNLIHYRGSAAYTIYDSYNYPSYDTAASANTVARRDANGYLRCVYINTSNSAESPASYSGALAAFYSTDGWLRKSSMANFATALPAASSSQKGVLKIVTSSSAPSTYASDTLYLISG